MSAEVRRLVLGQRPFTKKRWEERAADGSRALQPGLWSGASFHLALRRSFCRAFAQMSLMTGLQVPLQVFCSAERGRLGEAAVGATAGGRRCGDAGAIGATKAVISKKSWRRAMACHFRSYSLKARNCAFPTRKAVHQQGCGCRGRIRPRFGGWPRGVPLRYPRRNRRADSL